MLRFYFSLASRLPLGILYVKSNVIAFLLQYIFRYRRQVILENMKNSFPEKTGDELQTIRTEYYRHMSDLIVESIKGFRIKKQDLKRRIRIVNLPDFNRYADERQSVIVLLGHTSNWEWNGLMMGLTANFSAQVVYRQLSNKNIDRLVFDLRSRFGCKPISEKNIARNLISKKLEQTATAFIADQTPSNKQAYKTTFLNQETYFFNGAEKLSRKLNLPVLYASTRKLKRGYYLYRFEIITDDPASTPENYIMQTFAEKLERDIKNQPWNWLWSHKRWKKKLL